MVARTKKPVVTPNDVQILVTVICQQPVGHAGRNYSAVAKQFAVATDNDNLRFFETVLNRALLTGRIERRHKNTGHDNFVWFDPGDGVMQLVS